MKILIIRCMASLLDLKNNTYNLQEIGLAKALVRKGHEVDVIFWTDSEEKTVKVRVENDKEINVIYKKSKVILKNSIFDLDLIIDKYDIVQASEYNQFQSWILAKKYFQKTVIYHGPYYSKFNKKYNLMCYLFDLILLPRYIKYNTKFIAKSYKAKQFLLNKGIKENNICVAGVGIDLDVFNTNNDTEYDNVVEIPKNRINLLYIGRIEKRRNTKFLLNLIKYINDKTKNKYQLILIGKGNLKYVEECKELIVKLEISNDVIWIEKLEQKYLQTIYKNCEYFLLPTEYEIFGMVLLESMYFSTKVITTSNGGSDMLIKNQCNGYIIDELSVSKWTDIIENNLFKNEVAKKANETIVNKFTWSVLIEKFIEVYEVVKNENTNDK